MARMPQIPQPEIGNRPDSHVPPAEMLNVKGVEESFTAGAQAISGVGDQVARLQAERDAAQAKLQKASDGIKATRMAGDHAEAARNLSDQLQKQFWDTPDKFPDEFRKQLTSMTDSEVRAAPNQNIGLDIAQKYATIDNQQTTAAHGWMVNRLAQRAKSDLTALSNSYVRSAQAQSTLGGLALSIGKATTELEPHLSDIHGDPEHFRDKMQHDMTAGWVEANSPLNPIGISRALDQKNGPLVDHLSADERAKYQRRAVSDLKGYQEVQRLQTIKEAIDHGAKSYDLFLSGELDSRNVYQMKDALEKKQTALAANPNITDSEKDTQGKIIKTQLNTLRYLDEAARKGDHFDATFDQGKQTKLYESFAALGKPTDKTPKDLLKIVQLRHDLAEAQATRVISDARAATMNKALTQLTGKSMTNEAKNTGWHIPFLGYVKQSPQQAGNVALNSYIDGGNKAFGKLTNEQGNDARWAYLEQVVEAQEAGRNLDSKSAETMAYNALVSVTQRAHSRGGGR